MYPYLFALEKALLVTVGDVQRESQDPRSVLHALNEIIQSSPAGPLHTSMRVCMISMCVCAPELKIMVQNAPHAPESKNNKVGNTSTNEDFSNLAFHSVHTTLSRVKAALRGVLADLSELVTF